MKTKEDESLSLYGKVACFFGKPKQVIERNFRFSADLFIPLEASSFTTVVGGHSKHGKSICVCEDSKLCRRSRGFTMKDDHFWALGCQ